MNDVSDTVGFVHHFTGRGSEEDDMVWIGFVDMVSHFNFPWLVGYSYIISSHGSGYMTRHR